MSGRTLLPCIQLPRHDRGFRTRRKEPGPTSHDHPSSLSQPVVCLERYRFHGCLEWRNLSVYLSTLRTHQHSTRGERAKLMCNNYRPFVNSQKNHPISGSMGQGTGEQNNIEVLSVLKNPAPSVEIPTIHSGWINQRSLVVS